MPATKKATPRQRSKAIASPRVVIPGPKNADFNGGWLPRPYQDEKFQRFNEGVRYHFYVWHRRAGKDSFALNLAADQQEKVVGTYWHLFPLHVQARRAIWKGMDNNGLKFIDQAFGNIIKKVHETDMMLEFKNGSTWQMTGSDYYDRLVGSNVRGAVFSEWALCDPRAWNFVRPIIRENGGWACFITTFRGRNHAYQMYQRLKKNPEWSCEILTVDDTKNWDGSAVLTEEDIQAERDSGMSEAMIQQEYYCNPLAAAEGAIYGASVSKLLANKNTEAQYDPKQPVTAAWSLEYLPVNVSVVFAQGKNIIGSRSWMFETFATALSEVEHAFPWSVGAHVLMWSDHNPDLFANFSDAGIFPKTTLAPDEARITQLAGALIQSGSIDTKQRNFEEEPENNLLLIEALNGYSARETALNTWSLTGVTEYHYLTRAFETYAVWESQNSHQHKPWGPKIDTTQHDRGVI
jgi:hypothetical protein